MTRTAEPATLWTRVRARGAVLRSRVEAVRARVRATPGGRVIWRVGVTIVGVAVIAGGIVLLPLPGPGWVIIFAGLGILATEYPWASRLLLWLRALLLRWTHWLARQSRPVQVAAGAIGLVFLAAIAIGLWFAYQLM